MSLRFFADQCVSNLIIQSLQNVGHEVLRLKDHLPTNAIDKEVLLKAQEKEAILLSLNGDFADIVVYPPDQYKGIVTFQIKNHPRIIPQLIETLIHYLDQNLKMDFYRGKLFIIEPHRIRILK